MSVIFCLPLASSLQSYSKITAKLRNLSLLMDLNLPTTLTSLEKTAGVEGSFKFNCFKSRLISDSSISVRIGATFLFED